MSTEEDSIFDDVDVGLSQGFENAISTSDGGNVDALLKELDSEFHIGGDSDDEDVLGLDGGASDVAAATPSIVESAIDSLVVASSSPVRTDPTCTSSSASLSQNVDATATSSESAPISSEDAAVPMPTASACAQTQRSNVDDSVQRLRSSTTILAQSISNRTRATADTIDQRYNLRESVSQSVSKLDSDYSIKAKTSSLWSSLRGGVALVGSSISAGASDVDSRYQISSKATDVKSTVAEKTKVATSEIGSVVTERFGDKISKVGVAVGNVGSSVRQVDEKFGISTKAVGALADGADLLAKGLGGTEGGESGGNVAASDVGLGDAASADDAATPPVTKKV